MKIDRVISACDSAEEWTERTNIDNPSLHIQMLESIKKDLERYLQDIPAQSLLTTNEICKLNSMINHSILKLTTKILSLKTS